MYDISRLRVKATYFCCSSYPLSAFPFQKCIQGNNIQGKIRKNEMVGACGACGGGERCAQDSGWET